MAPHRLAPPERGEAAMRTATKVTITTVAVLLASMFDASEHLAGFQEEHPRDF
jgi:hypothetical protein